jgi:hypothetical protein
MSATSSTYHPQASLTRGGQNRRRPGFQNFVRTSAPNYSKPLPPDPPVSLSSRRSSSVYSQVTNAFGLRLSIPPLTDFPPKITPKNPFSTLLDATISQPLSPSLPSTCSHRTLSVSTQSPSSIDVGPSTPATTHYNYTPRLWSGGSPVSPLQTQFSGSCSQKVLYHQCEPNSKACLHTSFNQKVYSSPGYVPSLARRMPDGGSNNRHSTDSDLSSIYQLYIAGECHGEVSSLQGQPRDETLRDGGNQDQKSRLTVSLLSQVNRNEGPHPGNMGGVHVFRTDHILARPVPPNIPRPSCTAPQNPGLLVDMKTSTQQESMFCVERQQATPTRGSRGRQLKETFLHQSSSTDTSDPSRRVNESAFSRRMSRRSIKDLWQQQAHAPIETVSRLLPAFSRNPVSPLESYTAGLYINSVPNNAPRTWQNPGSSNTLPTDSQSIIGCPNTALRNAHFSTDVPPPPNNPGKIHAEDYVGESRFSVSTLADPESKATRGTLRTLQDSLLFLSKILPYSSLDVETDTKKRTKVSKGLGKTVVSRIDSGIINHPDRPQRAACREGWI